MCSHLFSWHSICFLLDRKLSLKSMPSQRVSISKPMQTKLAIVTSATSIGFFHYWTSPFVTISSYLVSRPLKDSLGTPRTPPPFGSSGKYCAGFSSLCLAISLATAIGNFSFWMVTSFALQPTQPSIYWLFLSPFSQSLEFWSTFLEEMALMIHLLRFFHFYLHS